MLDRGSTLERMALASCRVVWFKKVERARDIEAEGLKVLGVRAVLGDFSNSGLAQNFEVALVVHADLHRIGGEATGGRFGG